MFKPLLAEEFDLDKVRFPLMVSPKLDGIRAIICRGKAWSRSGKALPNKYIQTHAYHLCNEAELGNRALDVEILTYNSFCEPPRSFNDIQSDVMTAEGYPKFIFHAIDLVPINGIGIPICGHAPFKDRYAQMNTEFHLQRWDQRFVQIVHQKLVNNMEELSAETSQLLSAFEGVMVRRPDGRYKCGRSTVREALLLKIKEFADDEAVIVGFKQEFRNGNELEADEFGYAKRTSHQENMFPTGRLGAFQVLWNDIVFDIGSGFTHDQRKDFWERQEQLLGRTITFKYQKFGMKVKPRIPIFKGFRPEVEL